MKTEGAKGPNPKRIFCTVTNDLTFDQRMIRICTSLAAAGYRVTLVGRTQKRSVGLEERPYAQKRLRVFFGKGKLFYIEYNVRLLIYLLLRRADAICAIDLDSITACYAASVIKRVPRVYDAHELFCEMKEVVSRPAVYRIWKAVERRCVPHFIHGYTVNRHLANEFARMYGVEYEVIRNMPRWEEPVTGRADGSDETDGRGGSDDARSGSDDPRGGFWDKIRLGEDGCDRSEMPADGERFILYQGAVNEGRCFETLIPAMQQVDARLMICGKGNYLDRTRQLVRDNGLEGKVIFTGPLRPSDLKLVTKRAWCGLTLFENRSMNNYYSLANRFFDYIHAGIPQLTMNYPAYKEINNIHPIAVLLDEPAVGAIADGLNKLLNDSELYAILQGNCALVGRQFSWQEEEKKLIRLYQKVLIG